MTQKYAVPAVDKAFDVLECLTEEAKPLTQSEIASKLERSPNEIYRVLVGLEARGYLTRDKASGAYSLSLKLYHLSRSISPIDQIRQIALPVMEDFAVASGFSCHLSVLYQSQVMVLIHARSPSPVSLNITEGSLFSSTKTASGKILLANSNDDVQAMILSRDEHFQVLNAPDKECLKQSLLEIKQNGYVLESSQLTNGVFEVSTLIGRPEGKVIAALTVSSLSSQNGEGQEHHELLASLKEVAEAITNQLQC